MRKIFSFLFTVTFFATVHAQVIDRNDIIIQAGGGLGIYHYQFTDVTNNVVQDRDTSASWTFPFQVEYGVNRWLGAGLAFTFNNFIEGDSASGEKATVLDFVPTVNLHVPWSLKKFDLSANIGYGYSRFKYEINDLNHGIAKAGGTVLVVGVNPRLYFGESARFGITGWYRYTKHNYKEGTVTDDSNLEYKFKLDGPGNSFGLGLVFKI